jgi:hypothetical protein
MKAQTDISRDQLTFDQRVEATVELAAEELGSPMAREMTNWHLDDTYLRRWSHEYARVCWPQNFKE